jgi:hypothetical protein
MQQVQSLEATDGGQLPPSEGPGVRLGVSCMSKEQEEANAMSEAELETAIERVQRYALVVALYLAFAPLIVVIGSGWLIAWILTPECDCK